MGDGLVTCAAAGCLGTGLGPTIVPERLGTPAEEAMMCPEHRTEMARMRGAGPMLAFLTAYRAQLDFFPEWEASLAGFRNGTLPIDEFRVALDQELRLSDAVLQRGLELAQQSGDEADPEWKAAAASTSAMLDEMNEAIRDLLVLREALPPASES